MKKVIWLTMGLMLVVALVGVAADDPVAILEKTVQRPYRDLTLNVHLVKTAKSGRERPMDLMVKIKDDGKTKKTLVEFTGPDEVKGMKSLSWVPASGAESEQWFKLAGLEWTKCRGRACERLEEQFGFSMEIFAVKLENAVHALKGVETLDGAACYKIESKLKNLEEREDPMIVTWVDKEKFVARKIEAYDQDKKLTQFSTFSKFQMIGDHWWETEGLFTKLKSGRKLAFRIVDFKINSGLADKLFAKPEKFKLEEGNK